MNILVTGAGGFIGSRLAGALAADGHAVIGTWYRNAERLTGDTGNVRFSKLDLCDVSGVGEVLGARTTDAVVHCAARLAVEDERRELTEITRDNVLGQANMIDAALAAGCEYFINCSSISVYGARGAPVGGYREGDVAPVKAYGWSKRAGEELLDLAAARQKTLRALSLRLAGVHGSGRTSGALSAMTRAASAGKPITISEPASRFRWLFIEDLIDAVRLALAGRVPEGHTIVNLASRDEFTLGDLAERIRSATGSNSVLGFGDTAIERNEVMNIDAACALLGYEPQPFEEAVATYISDLRRSG